jgi:NADPH:quinone reductase
MTHAIRIQRFGGPEVLEWCPVDVAMPGAREVLLRQVAVGVNYADVYMRSGTHPAVRQFPATLGIEAAGIIETVGSEVRDFAAGDRVAYFGSLGAYSEQRVVPADRLLKLPASIDFPTAAAMMVKGVTAQYLCRQAYPVGPEDVVLIHAAAGGIGSFLSQWSAAMGANVIGTVGSEAKIEIARDNGCHDVIVATRESVPERVAALTGGRKTTVVFDALGGDATLLSLDCLRPRGTLVIFGRTAGYPAAIKPFEHLMEKGSLKVTMTQLVNFTAAREQLEGSAADLFAAVAQGQLKPRIGQSYALRDTSQAHRDLEARNTVGSIVLNV